MQRLQTRPQFQATLAGGTVSRTAHFALHRLVHSAAARADAATAITSATEMPQVPSAPAKAVLLPLFPGGGLWMGAMVPKRWARRAVTRNAIKRQVYQVSQTLAGTLPPAAHVVRLRSAFDRQQFVSASSDVLKQAVRQELLALFSRAERAAAPAVALPPP